MSREKDKNNLSAFRRAGAPKKSWFKRFLKQKCVAPALTYSSSGCHSTLVDQGMRLAWINVPMTQMMCGTQHKRAIMDLKKIIYVRLKVSSTG